MNGEITWNSLETQQFKIKDTDISVFSISKIFPIVSLKKFKTTERKKLVYFKLFYFQVADDYYKAFQSAQTNMENILLQSREISDIQKTFYNILDKVRSLRN